MATKKFQTLNDYCNYVNKQLEKCMDEVGRQLKNEMANYIFEKVYRTRTPKEYERTFQILDSITYKLEKQGNGSYAVRVGYDTNLITPKYEDSSFFNVHMSLSGEDMSDITPYFIEKGNGVNPYKHYDGVNALEFMCKYMEDYATVKLATLLHQKGIKIK